MTLPARINLDRFILYKILSKFKLEVINILLEAEEAAEHELGVTHNTQKWLTCSDTYLSIKWYLFKTFAWGIKKNKLKNK